MQLHRLVRNEYGRTIYNRLRAAGITATWLSEFTKSVAGLECQLASKPYAVGCIHTSRAADFDVPVAKLVDDEIIVGAVESDDILGYLFLSIDETLEIRPLERPLSFDGGYIRRVFVAPEHRRRGVASTMLDQACILAAHQGASRVTALVARDNIPSRTLFKSNGFRVCRDHQYVRIGPLSYYAVSDRE